MEHMPLVGFIIKRGKAQALGALFRKTLLMTTCHHQLLKERALMLEFSAGPTLGLLSDLGQVFHLPEPQTPRV